MVFLFVFLFFVFFLSAEISPVSLMYDRQICITLSLFVYVKIVLFKWMEILYAIQIHKFSLNIFWVQYRLKFDVKLIVPNVQTGAACTRLWALTGGSLFATPPEAAAMPTGTNVHLGQRSPSPFLWGIGFTCLGMQRLFFNIPVFPLFLV